MKRVLNVIIGSIIIGVTFSVFFVPYNIICSGLFGAGEMIYLKYNLNPGAFILLFNMLMIILGINVLEYEKIKRYFIPSVLIPVVIFITSLFPNFIDLSSVDSIVLAITGAFLIGFGASFIYKEGCKVGGFEITQDILNSYKTTKSKFFTYVVEILIFLVSFVVVGFEYAMYSLISSMIIAYMSTKTRIGISSSKTFFIITTKEKEVKNYLIKELKYDYTEFSSKGGFSNERSKVIMTVIDTKDYYMLKEGISLIDENAFISIIDNYEAINKNVTINKG